MQFIGKERDRKGILLIVKSEKTNWDVRLFSNATLPEAPLPDLCFAGDGSLAMNKFEIYRKEVSE